ncbi:hypothetical protein ACWF95_35025 [Streptomyces vinaceus]
MSDTPRARARQAELTAAHQRELSEAQIAIDNALEEVERRRKAYAKSAGRIAEELGRGGASALARHLDVSAQYVSTLIASSKEAPVGTERSAAA